MRIELNRRRRRGFTFVELMIVMAIIAVLLSVAIPIYSRSIVRAKESVLKNNLFTMRTVIDEYTYDKQKAPQTLQDLVSDGYLRQIPHRPDYQLVGYVEDHPGRPGQHGEPDRAGHIRCAQRVG